MYKQIRSAYDSDKGKILKCPKLSDIRARKWERETREGHQSITPGHSQPEIPCFWLKLFQQASRRSPGPPKPPCVWPVSDDHQRPIHEPFLCNQPPIPGLSLLCVSPQPSLSVANVNLANFLSLRSLRIVPCFFCLADRLFLLTGLAAGKAEISCLRAQSSPG